MGLKCVVIILSWSCQSMFRISYRCPFDRLQLNDLQTYKQGPGSPSQVWAICPQKSPKHVPPKSGLKRMSYPFSNLSTVVLATDMPVLPVEELRAETSMRTCSKQTNKQKPVIQFDILCLRTTRWSLGKITACAPCSQLKWVQPLRGGSHYVTVFYQEQRGSLNSNSYIQNICVFTIRCKFICAGE